MDPNTVLCTVALRGTAAANLSNVPDEGFYVASCTKVEAKVKNGRTTLWTTLTTDSGQTIYDYINVPLLTDKDGSEAFFKRTLVAFGVGTKEKVDALKTGPEGIPLKAGYFLGKKVMVHFFPPIDGYRAQITYITPDQYADAQSGALKITRSDGSKKVAGAGGGFGGGIGGGAADALGGADPFGGGGGGTNGVAAPPNGAADLGSDLSALLA